MKVEVKLKGEYKLQVLGQDGNIKVDTDWFDNVITVAALDAWCQTTAMNNLSGFCGVGTGTATPASSDVGITGQIGSRAARFSNGNNVVGLVNTVTQQYNFPVSGVIGTISEVGIFSASTGGILLSRTLIKAAGTPTTITLVSGDTLYVIWRCTMTAPADVTGTTTIGGVSYNYTLRPSKFTTSTTSAYGLWAGSVGINSSGSDAFNLHICAACSTQTLGAVTGEPAGTSYPTATYAASAYTPGTFTRTFTYTFAVGEGNAPGGIGSLIFHGNTSGAVYCGFQASFSAVSGGASIPKDGTKTFTIPLTVTVSG